MIERPLGADMHHEASTPEQLEAAEGNMSFDQLWGFVKCWQLDRARLEEANVTVKNLRAEPKIARACR